MKKILFFLLIKTSVFGQVQVKISDMPAATDLTGTVYFPIIQGSVNKKASPSLFSGYLGLTSLATTTPGTGVATALGVNIGSAGAPIVNGGAGGTPSSLTGTNITGIVPTTGILGWPANPGATRLLQIDASNNYSWVASGGGGSGTVNSGTLGQLAYYAGAGTTVSGTTNLTVDTNNSINAGSVTTRNNTNDSIVFIGTSITLGVTGLPSRYYNFPTVAIRALNGFGFKQYNLGNSGTRLDQNVSAIPTKTAGKRWLVIEFGSNEAVQVYDTATYRTNWATFLSAALSKGWSYSNMTIVSLFGGQVPVVGTLAYMRGYNKVDSTVAKKNGIAFADCFNPLRSNNAQYGYVVTVEGSTLHPGIKSCEIMGAIVAGTIVPDFSTYTNQRLYSNGSIEPRQINFKNVTPVLVAPKLLAIDGTGKASITNVLPDGITAQGIFNYQKAFVWRSTLLPKTAYDSTIDHVVPTNMKFIAGIASNNYSSIEPYNTATGNMNFRLLYQTAGYNFYTANGSNGGSLLGVSINSSGVLNMGIGGTLPFGKTILSTVSGHTGTLTLLDAGGIGTVLSNDYSAGFIDLKTGTTLATRLRIDVNGLMTITPGTLTGLTTATEFILEKHASATWTWVDGTTALQRFNADDAMTVNKTTTSATFTDIYGRFTKKSIAGSGVTFTRNWGFGTDGNLQVQGSLYVGAASVAPTALLHLAAGTASANTAPEKFTSGPLLATIETGTGEYNNARYFSSNALNRYGPGGAIADFVADVGNSGSSETDLFTYTTKASTLSATGEKLTFTVTGNIVGSATASRTINCYFAGTNIGTVLAATISTTGNFKAVVEVIRTSSTTARTSVVISVDNLTLTTPVTEIDLTGLTFTNTNIIKITGTSSGTGSASNDIVAKLGWINWFPAANN